MHCLLALLYSSHHPTIQWRAAVLRKVGWKLRAGAMLTLSTHSMTLLKRWRSPGTTTKKLRLAQSHQPSVTGWTVSSTSNNMMLRPRYRAYRSVCSSCARRVASMNRCGISVRAPAAPTCYVRGADAVFLPFLFVLFRLLSPERYFRLLTACAPAPVEMYDNVAFFFAGTSSAQSAAASAH